MGVTPVAGNADVGCAKVSCDGSKGYRPARRVWWPLGAAGLVALLTLVACNAPAAPLPTPEQPTATRPAPSPTAPPATPSPPSEPTPTPVPTIPPDPTSPPGEKTPERPYPFVSVGNTGFQVDVAQTPEERSLGLSGRPSLAPGTGMLFVFEEESSHSFWMKEMQFPLDFLWIDTSCAVADITVDVPPPAEGTELSELPTYQPQVPVRFVLEINAGDVAAAGISVGDPATFQGSIAGRYGC